MDFFDKLMDKANELKDKADTLVEESKLGDALDELSNKAGTFIEDQKLNETINDLKDSLVKDWNEAAETVKETISDNRK